MPLYEFTCASCGQQFEELCKADDALLCPHCGAKGVTRLMSACARNSKRDAGSDYASSASGGCGGCSGGNCGSCHR